VGPDRRPVASDNPFLDRSDRPYAPLERNDYLWLMLVGATAIAVVASIFSYYCYYHYYYDDISRFLSPRAISAISRRASDLRSGVAKRDSQGTMRKNSALAKSEDGTS